MDKQENGPQENITPDKNNRKGQSIFQEDEKLQKATQKKPSSDIICDNLNTALISKNVAMGIYENLPLSTASDSFLKNGTNALMRAVLKNDRKAFNMIWNFIKRTEYHRNNKVDMGSLGGLNFNSIQMMMPIISDVKPIMSKSLVKCDSTTWLIDMDDDYISGNGLVDLSSKQMQKLEQPAWPMLQASIQDENEIVILSKKANTRAVTYESTEDKWDTFFSTDGSKFASAPSVKKIDSQGNLDSKLLTTPENYNQKITQKSYCWNPCATCNAIGCNIVLADEGSLQNVFFNALLKSDFEFEEDMLHQINDSKQLLIFIHSMLQKLQLLISPENIMTFIIRQYVISSIHCKVEKERMLESGASCGCIISTSSINNANYTRMHRKKNLTKYSARNDRLLDAKLGKYDSETMLSTKMPSLKNSAKKQPQFSKFLGTLSNNNSRTLSKKSKHDVPPFFKTENSKLHSLKDKSIFENSNDTMESLDGKSKTIKEGLYKGSFDKALIYPAIKKCFAAMILEFKCKSKASEDIWRTSKKYPTLRSGENQDVTERYVFPFQNEAEIVNDLQDNENEDQNFMLPTISIIRLESTSRWYQCLKELSRFIPNVMHQLLTRKGLVTFSSNSAYTLRNGKFGTYLGLLSSGLPITVRSLKMETSMEYTSHPHLPQSRWNVQHLTVYYDAVPCPADQCVYVVSELCEFNLAEYLRKPKNVLRSPNGELYGGKFFISDFVEGMAYLHSFPEPVIHGHLKPSNLMITHNGRLKISDFYLLDFLSIDFGIITRKRGQKFSDACWRPQELISAPKPEHPRTAYTKAGDIQVAGMLVYHILSVGKHPFGFTERDCQMNIINGKSSFGATPSDPESRDMIQSMIQHNPLDRISMATALKHPYFWDIEKKFQFLIAVGKAMHFIKGKPLILLELLTASCLEARDWVYYIHEPLLEFMHHRNKIYENNFTDLLRFAIELDVIFNSLPAALKAIVRKPSKYTMTNFPTILMSIYEIFRRCEVWQFQLGLTSFF